MKLPLGKRRERGRKASSRREKARIFSYTSARNAQDRPLNRGDDNDQPKVPADKHHGKISKAINYTILAVVLYGVAYLCVLQTDAQIKISGQKVYPRDKISYEQAIDRQLGSSIFYRTKLTFDTGKLSAKIREEFPEVNDIKITIPFIRHRPIVEVTLAKPAAKLVTGNKTYILDEQGRALFEQKYASASLNIGSLLSINDDSGQDIILGKPALTERQISYIREIIGQTSAKGLQARSFALSSGGTAVDARFENLPYFVKFSFDADAKQSSGAFIAINGQLKNEGALPAQYIDLRVPEKAFVK